MSEKILQICDKCGKELDKKNVSLYVKENYSSRLPCGLPRMCTVGVQTRKRSFEYFNEKVDLCEECTKEFCEWVKESRGAK